MNVREVAEDFAAKCKAGAFEDAGRSYWSDDVRSVEAMEGPGAVAEGLAAVLAKGEWWYGAHEVHSVITSGPYVNGEQFALRFQMDITVRETGVREQSDEVAIYTVRDGKVVEERFFY